MRHTPQRWHLIAPISAAFILSFTLNAHAGKIGGPNDDYDGDGLTNAQEKLVRTNPKKADTDKDGLSDGVEVNDTQTNPKRKDSDRDHLSDSQELALQTDPLDDDSDDDGVEDGDEVKNDTDPLDSDTDDDGVEDGDDPEPGEHGAEFEVRGLVTAVTDNCQLTVTTDSGSIQIDASSAVLLEVASCLDLAGQLVEVEGELKNGVMQAKKVHLEDDPNAVEVEIRGQVTAVNANGGCLLTVTTSAGDVQVNATTATLRGVATCAALAGLRVEAEGEIISGVLVAKKVKVEDD